MDAISAAYDGDIPMIDSTSVRAHQQAATAKREVEIIVSVARGAVSRPRSAVVDRQGSPGPAWPDGGSGTRGLCCATLLDQLDPCTIMLADKAYDGNAIRDLIEGRGAVQHPGHVQPQVEALLQQDLYRERNQVERFTTKLKHFRRSATRYYRFADGFPAMVKQASLRIWLRTMSLRPGQSGRFAKEGCIRARLEYRGTNGPVRRFDP